MGYFSCRFLRFSVSCVNPIPSFILYTPEYYKKWKYTPAVRSKISSKLIFASCVWYSDRAYYEFWVLIEDIGRRLPLQLQCSCQGQQGDFSQSVRGNFKTRFWGGQNLTAVEGNVSFYQVNLVSLYDIWIRTSSSCCNNDRWWWIGWLRFKHTTEFSTLSGDMPELIQHLAPRSCGTRHENRSLLTYFLGNNNSGWWDCVHPPPPPNAVQNRVIRGGSSSCCNDDRWWWIGWLRFKHTTECSTLSGDMPELIQHLAPRSCGTRHENRSLLTYFRGNNSGWWDCVHPPPPPNAVQNRVIRGGSVDRYTAYTLHRWSHVMYEQTHSSSSSSIRAKYLLFFGAFDKEIWDFYPWAGGAERDTDRPRDMFFSARGDVTTAVVLRWTPPPGDMKWRSSWQEARFI